MRQKFLLGLLLLSCFFVAWIGASYAKLWLSNGNGLSSPQKPSTNTSVVWEQSDTPELTSVFGDNRRSDKPLNFEEMLTTLDLDSLDGILAIENDSFRRLMINEYLAQLALSDFPRAINDLITQAMEGDGDYWADGVYKKRECLDRMISVWFQRDFEKAKEFVLGETSSEEKADEEIDGFRITIPLNLITDDFALDRAYKDGFRSYLLKEWIKRNKGECLEFVRENTADKEAWVRECITVLSMDNPQDSYSLLESCPEYEKNYWTEDAYRSLFLSWYEKEGRVALETALDISSNPLRKKVIEVLSTRIVRTNPIEAVDLIRKEYPSDNGSKPYFLFEMGKWAEKEENSGLNMIRQGDFSDVERKALLCGYISEMSLTSLNELLGEDTRYNFSQEERSMLIKERLSSAISYQKGTGVTHVDMRSIPKEDNHLALQLFRELSTEEQEKVCINRLETSNKELSLLMYNELPPEKQLNTTRQKLFESLIREDVTFAGEYFLEHLYDGSLTTQDVKLGGVMFSRGKDEKELLREIINQYSQKDIEGAESWITSIPDENLKNTAAFLLSAASWKSDPAHFVSQLNSIKDEKLGNSVLDSIIDDELFSDQKVLLPIANGLKNTALAQKLVDESADRFLTVSSDSIFDFIEGLEHNSGIQEYAREKFYDKALGQDPKLALEIALEMSPGEVTAKRIQRAFSAFQRETPERAARWLKENNIKLSQ